MNAKAYKFSPYLLEVEQKKLHRDGQLVPMTPKRFEILLLLIERAGQVVRKEEIMQRVWPGQEVEESNLTQHVFFLRRALGDDPRTPSYIMTIPGAGYLFYQPVQVVREDGSEETIGGFQAHQSINLLGEQVGAAKSEVRPVIEKHSWLNKRIAISAFLLLAGLITASALWWRFSKEENSVFTPTVEPIVTMPGAKGDLKFSSDGKYLAFTSEGDTVDSLNVFVQSMEGGTPTRLTRNPFTDHQVTWSPDNKQIAFLRYGSPSSRKKKIIIVPASGGEERVIGEALHGLDWSPDGQSLAISDSNGLGEPTGIFLLSIQSKRIAPVSRPNPNENIFDSDPQFSPDGKSIAFTRWKSGANGDLLTIDLATGKMRQLTFDRSRIGPIQWSPNGSELFFVSNRTGNLRIWKIPVSGGDPAPFEGPLGEVERFTINKSASNENMLAYIRSFTDTNILVENLPGKGLPPSERPPCSINSTRDDSSPQFSPDNSRIVFMSGRSGFNEIWMADADCKNVTQLTNFREQPVGSPRWSPDGKKILFDRLVNEQADVFIYELESGQVRQLTNNQSPDFLPAWSADGREIFFCSERQPSQEIWKMKENGEQAMRLTKHGGFESWASDDGTNLFFIKYNSLFKLDLTTFDEQKVEELKDVFLQRYWTLRGDSIFYLTREIGNRCRIQRFDLKTRTISQVLELIGSPSKFVPGLSVSPDGTRLAISLINYNPGDISLIRGWR
jgi:Tol biopolymer transport system component/DNA-binding winged helix-turn-helix (wHTH) protein